MPVSGRLIIKDYAYESAVATPIAAGDVGTAIEPGSLPAGYLFSEVAPHPVVGSSTFDVAVGNTERVRVDLVDVRGRIVATLFDDVLPGGQQRRLTVDTAGLAGGLYLLRMTGESFVSTRRVAVVR